jgi:TusA-related sulfurtransferase/predicted peroxiredoxin
MGSHQTGDNHLDLRGNGLATDIVARAINRLDAMKAGEALSLEVDSDEAIDSDLRAWCEATGNHLLEIEDHGDTRTYLIEKGVPIKVVHKMALVLSSAAHDHLEAPLSLAQAAALEGVGVSIFFEGPAVAILTAAFPTTGSGLRRSRRTARRDAFERVRQIHDLGGDLYACERSLRQHHVRREEIAFERVIHAEYLTFLPVMEDADIQLLA